MRAPTARLKSCAVTYGRPQCVWRVPAAAEGGLAAGAGPKRSAREGIGRAKSVPADRYVEAYAQLVRQMEEQISAVAEKGEEAP